MIVIRERLQELLDDLTPSERQVATVILADYPFAGLEPIAELSRRAGVSAPSVSRFVTKLGFQGLIEFQQTLLGELKESHRSPIDLHGSLENSVSKPLDTYLQNLASLQTQMSGLVTSAQFDRLCTLLGDPRRQVFMLGGRMSDSIASFFARHLRQIRGGVFHMAADEESWPDSLLQMRPRDVLLLIDFRRYQPNLERLAQLAKSRRAQTIVVTDIWLSPASRGATEIVAVPVDSGTMWDSYVPAFALFEALLLPLAERDWAGTRERIGAWDKLRGSSEPFKETTE